MSDNNESDPKIIVDEDWKSQVEKEKEQLQKELETETSGNEPMGELPPASFEILVSTLSTQALASLGFLPDPASGQPAPNKALAKHFIDTLGVIDEKTKGNLNDDEANLLKETLHQLRMAFIQMPAVSAAEEPAPAAESKIELP